MSWAAYAGSVTDLVVLLGVLAELTYLTALRLLRDAEGNCVCELMARLGESEPRLPRHMATLRPASMVVDRRDAQWVRYRLHSALPAPVRRLLDAALELPPASERIAA